MPDYEKCLVNFCGMPSFPHTALGEGWGGKTLDFSGSIYEKKLSCPKAYINLICRVSTSIWGPTKVVFFECDVKRSTQIAL